MTSQTTSIYTPFADGRPVRDIVEHTPALVNETWCRALLRHTLDSLEQAYASGAPHRAITPDTLVMLANGEALLPSIDESADSTPSLAGDLHALALVVHYAITAELPPDGPLGPRLYDNYSEQLTKGLDSCLGPNRRLRPNTVDDMRALLGIEAGAGEVLAAPAAPVQAMPAEEAEPVAEPAPAVAFAEPPPVLDAAPTPFVEPAPALASTPISLEGTAGVPPIEETTASMPAVTEARMADAPPASDFSAPAIAPPPIDNPLPEVVAVPNVAAAPEAMQDPVPASPAPVSQRESAAAAMLRKPASEDGLAGKAHPARAMERTAPNASTLDAGAGPAPAAPLKPSAAPAAGLQPPADGGAPTTWATTDRSSRAQRWGMLAGAAIVVLAAGSALVSYLQQSDTRDPAPLSQPPAEPAATGLGAGETIVAPPSAGTSAEQATEAPAEGATDAAATPVPAASGTAPAAETGAASEAVVNGTTYKLVIKPWGTVYVDGVDRGVSPPIKRLTLGPGQHTIRIVNPNFPEHIMTVDAGLKETMIIEHDFTAKAE
jgi:hypothetical protein